jgi:hypothetical protein
MAYLIKVYFERKEALEEDGKILFSWGDLIHYPIIIA